MSMKPSIPALVAAVALGAVGVGVFSVSPGLAGFGGSASSSVEVLNELVVRVASGTVALDSESLDTLTSATALGDCTYTQGNPSTSIGGTPTAVPASPMANRTAVTVFNESSQPIHVLICSNDGTPPSATHGVRLRADGQFRKWEGAQAGWVVSCVCASGTCTVGVEEERCYQ